MAQGARLAVGDILRIRGLPQVERGPGNGTDLEECSRVFRDMRAHHHAVDYGEYGGVDADTGGQGEHDHGRYERIAADEAQAEACVLQDAGEEGLGVAAFFSEFL